MTTILICRTPHFTFPWSGILQTDLNGKKVCIPVDCQEEFEWPVFHVSTKEQQKTIKYLRRWAFEQLDSIYWDENGTALEEIVQHTGNNEDLRMGVKRLLKPIHKHIPFIIFQHFGEN
tara:strand:- start:87 stop:440 length:354 start_codon:yes stop_codon:yes gene_type:complete